MKFIPRTPQKAFFDVEDSAFMNILVYADLQADSGSERLFLDPTVSLRLWCVKKFYADIGELVVRHKCNAIYDLGDTFDDRTSLDIPTLDTVLDGLSNLPCTDNENMRLIGNHDQYQRNGTVNNSKVLGHYFSTVESRKITQVGGVSLFFASYPANYAELCEWLTREARRVRGPKILFGHFEVKGALYTNATALHGVPKETLAPFDLVVLGHIHLPQSLSPKIHYVGSPFQQDWGETGQSKRVGIVNTDTLTVEWLSLKGYPEYRKVSLTEFEKLITDQSEHRYRVVLNSHEETERFFKHPLFGRATSQYNYDETPREQVEENVDWSFNGICRRYLQTVSPAKSGITLGDDEMLEISQQVIAD